MGPCTDWHPYRDDPKTGSGWVLRAFRRLSWRMAGVAAGLVLATALTGESRAWLLFLRSLVATVVLARQGWRPVVPEAYDLLPKIPGVDRLLVNAFVRRRGLLIGEDQGMLSRIEGWLHFEGLRSGFSLGGTDVLWIASARQGAYELRLQDETQPLLRPHADSDLLDSGLRDWRADAAPATGDSRLLPTSPHGSALPEFVVRLAAGTILAALGVWILGRMFFYTGLDDVFSLAFGALILGFGLHQTARGLRGAVRR